MSNRRLAESTAALAAKLLQERYADFGPTLAGEKLASAHEMVISPDTVTGLLKARGLWVRKRRRGTHCKRRERRSRFGPMIQMDGSHHDWFEGRGPRCVMMVMIYREMNRVTLHQLARAPMKTFINSRRRRIFVVAFDVLAVMARSKPLWISEEPCAIGVAHDVISIVPGLAHREMVLPPRV